MSRPAQQIERLREWRGRRERDLAIEKLVEDTAAAARRAEGRLGSFVDLWEGLVPPDLASRTRVTGLRGGVAQVKVDSSSTAFELDRLLREGLEERLRRAYGKTLVRVKVGVGGP